MVLFSGSHVAVHTSLLFTLYVTEIEQLRYNLSISESKRFEMKLLLPKDGQFINNT